MNNHAPRVSIGLPVYNGERYLKETLDCILAQTFEDFELIISDNASTDETQVICQAYASRDHRIRYYRNDQNLGAAKNYNRVFELSTGKYFKWAAHDDVCAPEFLARCVQVLDRNPSVVLCYPRTIVIDEYGKHVDVYADGLNLHSSKPCERYKHYHNRFRTHRMCTAVFGLMRTNMLRLTPLIGNYTASDKTLLGEIALRGELYEVPEYLFFRRDHPQSSTRMYSMRERAVWFDPAKKSKIQLPWWRWFFEYLFAIRRVQMSWTDKKCCYIQMGKWLVWARGELEEELVVGVKQALGRLPGFIRQPVALVLRYSRRLVKAACRILRVSLSVFQ